MKLSITRFLTATLMIGVIGSASAKQWPSAATPPDTLTVFRIKTGLNLVTPGGPAVPDTVWGVKGIVTAFDKNPTGFGFYIQDPSSNPTNFGEPWTGVDVFSGGIAKNCQGVSVGDLVAVYGKCQAFQGLNELEGFDNVQATDDLIVRVISHGAIVPAPHVGLVSELKEVPQAAPAGADSVREKWEGMLVKVNGPLRVARNSLTGGLTTFSSYIVVDDVVCPISSSGPCDSMFVDGSTLTSIFPPSVGTVLSAVKGVYGQATRGYRIQLTSGNDQSGLLPPNLLDAYSIGDNVVQLSFDRDVDPASAVDVNNYYDGALFSPSSVTIVDGNTVNLTWAPSIIGRTMVPVGSQITVNTTGVKSVDLTPQGDSQARICVNGILTIMDVQSPNPDSLVAFLGCKDVSKYITTNYFIPSGSRVTMRGVCSGSVGSSNGLQDPSNVLRSGMLVFAPQCALTEGHQYLIAANLQEFGTANANVRETELAGTQYVQDEGAVAPIPSTVVSCAAVKSNACDASQTVINGEDYEDMLLTLPYVKVIRSYSTTGLPNPRLGGSFVVQDLSGTAADTLRIDNNVLTGYKPVVDDVFDLTGLLFFFSTTATSNDGATIAQFRLSLRKPSDLLFHGNNVNVLPGLAGKLALSVTPNPARTPVVSFTLSQKCVVEVSIFDLQGRKVRTLANGLMEAGNYTRAWDGRDASGKPAGSGVYFYRLRAGGENLTTRNVKVD